MTRLLVCRKDCVAHKRIKNKIWRNMQNVSPSLLHSVFSFQTRLEEFCAVNELWFSSLHLLAFVFALPVFYTFRLCFLSLFICHTNTICSLNGCTISMFPSSSEPTFPSSHMSDGFVTLVDSFSATVLESFISDETRACDLPHSYAAALWAPLAEQSFLIIDSTFLLPEGTFNSC